MSCFRRLTRAHSPAWQADELKAKVGKIVEEMNNDLSLLETRGPCSRYEIEGARGELELTCEASPAMTRRLARARQRVFAVSVA